MTTENTSNANGAGENVTSFPVSEIKDRQAWMAVLARAHASELETAWQDTADKPDYSLLRAPECGMVMVRARAGGEGQRFNMGEMSVTRCVVTIGEGLQGHAYIAGRDKHHAQLAAVFDALLQDETRRADIENRVLKPVRERLSTEQTQTDRKVAATRVDFFTMVRGH
ncbi:phosphonate C-P lyase system protein PhnG [Magnetovibrio sp. PR-2]|uniref:phosphonate C-P lyase system protein PhnG n=1 Tax=Magnetovibrio sp. PR-2 TaxID=3120356 RepID=UPI002FCDF3BA